MNRRTARARTETATKIWQRLRALDSADAHQTKISDVYYQLKDVVGLIPEHHRMGLSGTMERGL